MAITMLAFFIGLTIVTIVGEKKAVIVCTH